MPAIEKKTSPIIPLSVPRIEGNAWKYVKDCLDTQWVSSVGPYVRRFEREIERRTGAAHAVAGVNGTACLHAALHMMGVGPGDGVIVPSLTFIATANAATYTGATCVFMDCDPDRFNLDLDQLEDFLDDECVRRKGRLTTPEGVALKAIVPVHVLGYPLDIDRLLKIARRHKLIVIEDAAESIGSFWKGRHTGTFADAGVLSFNGNKIITNGGGGMVLTRDEALAKRARHVTQQAKSDPLEYVHDEIGFNYRMTNVAAALGLSQLELLPKFLRKRETLSRWYQNRLPDVPVEPIAKHVSWNRWMLSVQVPNAAEKTRLLRRLDAAGAQARPLWVPVPRQQPYRSHPCLPIPNAKRAYDTMINIPSSTSLTEADVDRVARVLRDAPLTRLIA